MPIQLRRQLCAEPSRISSTRRARALALPLPRGSHLITYLPHRLPLVLLHAASIRILACPPRPRPALDPRRRPTGSGGGATTPAAHPVARTCAAPTPASPLPPASPASSPTPASAALLHPLPLPSPIPATSTARPRRRPCPPVVHHHPAGGAIAAGLAAHTPPPPPSRPPPTAIPLKPQAIEASPTPNPGNPPTSATARDRRRSPPAAAAHNPPVMVSLPSSSHLLHSSSSPLLFYCNGRGSRFSLNREASRCRIIVT